MPPTAKVTVLSIVSVVLASLGHTLVAFNLFDHRWAPGMIDMELRLGSAGGLMDGSGSWDDCAMAGMDEWNSVLGPTGVRFNPLPASMRSPAQNDGLSDVFFADDIYGTPFGAQTLAVTSTFFFERDGVDETVESDVLVNTGKRFNCYRGPRQLGPVPETSNINDLRRVLTHEFGHVLGLGHPDDAGQTVPAIMNAFISDIDVLQLDDIQGALTLYGVAVTGIPFPPRDQVLGFFLSLETEYRDTLMRPRNSPGFVDAEGSAVWFPEWLRYVLNGCSATDAAERVLLQIGGQGIQPVCGVVAPGVINFPPRNESLDFLKTLDLYYQTTLGRGIEFSHIDLEGKAVWLQEYLRYRVNGCNDADATAKVLKQIRGGGIDPVCAT